MIARARVLALSAALGLVAAPLRAQDAQPFAPAPPPPVASFPPPRAPSGVLVVALEGATDVAWPLAQAVYGDSGLRPATLDDASARVLAGEPPRAEAPLRLRELAEVRAAIHGDDAASRRLLATLAHDLSVAAIALVSRTDASASCRLFLAESGQMDVVSFAPDAGEGPRRWSGAAEAMKSRLVRREEGPRALGPRLESPRPDAPKQETSKGGTFLSSKWFWGSLVVAAVAGALFFATRPSGGTDPATVQLHGHVAP